MAPQMCVRSLLRLAAEMGTYSSSHPRQTDCAQELRGKARYKKRKEILTPIRRWLGKVSVQRAGGHCVGVSACGLVAVEECGCNCDSDTIIGGGVNLTVSCGNLCRLGSTRVTVHLNRDQ